MSEPDVRTAMLTLLGILSEGASALEALAEDLGRSAQQAADATEAKALIELVRRARVKALEMRGRFTALAEEYEARFCSDP